MRNRTLRKKGFCPKFRRTSYKLFQQQKKANAPKLIEERKKTVYRKHGKFAKYNTEGAISYQVNTLSEVKTEAKAAFKKKLNEVRGNAKMKKKIEFGKAEETERGRGKPAARYSLEPSIFGTFPSKFSDWFLVQHNHFVRSAVQKTSAVPLMTIKTLQKCHR